MWRLLKVLPKTWRQKCGHLGCNPASAEISPCGDVETVPTSADQEATYVPPVTTVTACVEHQATNSILAQDSRFNQQKHVLRLGKRVSSQGGWRLPHWETSSLLEALGVGFAVLVGLRYGLRRPPGHHGSDDNSAKSPPQVGRHPHCPLSALFRIAQAINPCGLALSVLPDVNPGKLVHPVLPDVTYRDAGLEKNRKISVTSTVDEGVLDPTVVSPAVNPHLSKEDEILAEMHRLENDFRAHVLNIEAQDLLKQKRPRAAFEMFEEASDLGLDSAMFNLGVCYEMGVGVDQDLQLALEWYEEAASRGHSTALYNVAVFHLEGKGVAVDTNLGLACMKKACDAGVMEAQTYMGLHYGKKSEYNKAALLFQKAAQQKHADGQYLLGLCYENGLGIEENTTKAAELFATAASANHVDSNYRLATYYEMGLGGLTEDKTHALHLYKIAADANHPMAIKRLEQDLLTQVEPVRVQSPQSQLESPNTKPLRSVSSSPNLSAQNSSTSTVLSTFDFTKVKEFIHDYLMLPTKSHVYRFHLELDEPAYECNVAGAPISDVDIDSPVKAW